MKAAIFHCFGLRRVFLLPPLFFVLAFPICAGGAGAQRANEQSTGTAGTYSQSSPAPAGVPENTSEERIMGYFFYEELCGNCNDDEVNFMSILQEKIPVAERNKYPHIFRTVNIYETEGRGIYERVSSELGLDRGLLEAPFLILGGRVFQGYDSISANIREAYLTAAEDLFVYKRPYNPRTRKTGENLFDDYSVNPDHVTMVYFYRITCPECAEVTPIVDALPKTVLINGRERPLDIIRINTRSGNNGERIAAFFTAWEVPDRDRMVPIVFFSDSYLAGYNMISAELPESLSRTPVPWKLLQ